MRTEIFLFSIEPVRKEFYIEIVVSASEIIERSTWRYDRDLRILKGVRRKIVSLLPAAKGENI